MTASAALPAGDTASIESLRRLLESASAPAAAEGPVLLTDRLVGPVVGDLLRCCAVPHEFDCALLAWIGGIGPGEAEARYAQLTELSMMQVGRTSLSVHERWRESLWRWWLADAQRGRFVALSERLVEWFTRPASPTGEDPAARRRMFHLLGCRRDEGMAEFERLFRTARHRRRFSECSLLLRLVHEYNPVLAQRERALLSYHEGKIAIDTREWERALPKLQAVVGDVQADTHLRINAEVRMGHALRQLQQVDAARAALEHALARIDADPTAERSRWRVFYELGEIERDLGQVDRAAATLSQALARAQEHDDDADVAGVHNSLGTVQLRLRDTDAAAESFQASLEALRRRGDMLRQGTVLNNLGLTQLERCDWAAAAQAFGASLEIKRTAGDLLGQATTLLNLSRAQAAQGDAAGALDSAVEAQALFDRGGDPRGAALARQARERLASRQAGVEPSAAADRREKRLPWWAWVLIVLGLLLLAVLMFSVYLSGSIRGA